MCQKCINNLVLQNNQCVCAKGMSNVSGFCISCSIQYCLSCTASNVCSACSHDYDLVGNSCVCLSNKMIS